MLESGAVFAGHRIERLLGRGGMGSVYLARHPRLPRLTALKVLDPDGASDEVSRVRFEREAAVTAQLDHPNIVTVFDRGVEQHRLWISMQYVRGVDAATLDPETAVPERSARIVADIARALDFAHRRGIVHRDVKPANILLSAEPDQPERALLTDFGIAWLRDSSAQITRPGSVAATLAYAAPERLDGTVPDARSDQYSLACTMFRMLTGTTPFAGDNPGAVIRGHLDRPPPRITEIRDDLPPTIDDVVSRGLAKSPTERFPTCTDFAEAALAALTGTDPTAPRPAQPSVRPDGNSPTRTSQALRRPVGGAAVPSRTLVGRPPADPGADRPVRTLLPAPARVDGPSVPAAGHRAHSARLARTHPVPGRAAPSARPDVVVPAPVRPAMPGGEPADRSAESTMLGTRSPRTTPRSANVRPTRTPRRRAGQPKRRRFRPLAWLVPIVLATAAGSGGYLLYHHLSPDPHDVIHTAFPTLVPAIDGGSPNLGVRCTHAPPGHQFNGLDLGDWTGAWRCVPGPGTDEPQYAILAYPSRADRESTIIGLNPDWRHVEYVDGGMSGWMTAYFLAGPAIVSAPPGPDRNRLLVYADNGGTVDDLQAWLQRLPVGR
ncbi:serine/threonine-protein kinase [Nocardia rhizosphaerae]|uniref:non-specific serine/threonine protein kinase n=1 Tax=Nocardia rhizosphaerae TaxID=1691571 RepID=A0ABV8KYZ7_9NOCA